MVRITIDDSDNEGISTTLEGMPQSYVEHPEERAGLDYLVTLTPAEAFGMLAMNVLDDNKAYICQMMSTLHNERLKAKAESN